MRGITLIESLVYCALLAILLTGSLYTLWIETGIMRGVERDSAAIQDQVFSDDRNSQESDIYLP
jgi:hypothetical protein